jgi:predicted small integral membrane protein
MVVSSLAPLFLLWAIRGAQPISDCYWVTGCLALAIVPNLALLLRWRAARRSNDHRVIIVNFARDQSDHLLVYLFAMLLPLYSVNLGNDRELYAVAAAFVFIVFLFWHMNLHYMNIAFAALGYRVYTTEMKASGEAAGDTVILLSKRTSPPATGTSINGLRISDTVFVEKENANAERV